MKALASLFVMVAFAGTVNAQSPFGDLQVCATCHSSISVPSGAVDLANYRLHPRVRSAAQPAGDFIGPAVLWPGSMMAHSVKWKKTTTWKSWQDN